MLQNKKLQKGSTPTASLLQKAAGRGIYQGRQFGSVVTKELKVDCSREAMRDKGG